MDKLIYVNFKTIFYYNNNFNLYAYNFYVN